jgi:formate dehydrogenase subunit gamma
MTTSDNNTLATSPEKIKAAQLKKQALATHLRKAIALANRVQVGPDGSRRFMRFNQVEIFEHWILLFTFLVLAITGIFQLLSGLDFVAWLINRLSGGITTVSAIHDGAAIAFIALSLFHLVRIISIWFVKRVPGAMRPQTGDGSNLSQMFRYNRGKENERPQFDRYSIEEKLFYWGLLIFASVMVLTGLIQSYPTVITQFLPGEVVLIARNIHEVSAVIAIGMVLIWHLYHTVVKERNTSIFTGMLSEAAMKENHPLEYRRILTAYDEVQNLTKEA